VKSKPVQSQKAEGALQNANRAGAANAHQKVEVKSRCRMGVTKSGIAAQLQRRDERASKLEDQRYVSRVLARVSESKNKRVDQKARNRRQSAVGVAAKKTQAADRAASSKTKTFDNETRDAMTAESTLAAPLL
jgi:hypothetical protein